MLLIKWVGEMTESIFSPLAYSLDLKGLLSSFFFFFPLLSLWFEYFGDQNSSAPEHLWERASHLFQEKRF